MEFDVLRFCVVKVDEWGAVIKNQNEAYRRMEEAQQRQK